MGSNGWDWDSILIDSSARSWGKAIEDFQKYEWPPPWKAPALPEVVLTAAQVQELLETGEVVLKINNFQTVKLVERDSDAPPTS